MRFIQIQGVTMNQWILTITHWHKIVMIRKISLLKVTATYLLSFIEVTQSDQKLMSVEFENSKSIDDSINKVNNQSSIPQFRGSQHCKRELSFGNEESLLMLNSNNFVTSC